MTLPWRAASMISLLFLLTACETAVFGEAPKTRSSHGSGGPDGGGDPHDPDNLKDPEGDPDVLTQDGGDGATKLPSADATAQSGDCGEAGITKAVLKTPTVANGVEGNYIEYELSIVDCDGQPQALAGDSVQFDIDAYSETAGSGKKLGFKLSAPKLESVSGLLAEQKGADLFGNQGEDFYHYRTDKKLTLPSGAATVTLRVELMGQLFEPPDGSTVGASETYPTYLQLGTALPVRQDVEFVKK